MKQLTLSFLLALLPLLASADPVEINGIWYNLVKKAQEAEVAQNPDQNYSGQVDIPPSVTYDGTTYKVTSIGKNAFSSCRGLTSVTIPNSVKSIGISSFQYCSGMTSITIGKSVMSIGDFAFSGCSGLTAVHITDLEAWCKLPFLSYSNNPLNYAHHLYMNGVEIKDLVIPNSVTSIGNSAFIGCSGLTSVTIPNSVTGIGSSAFQNCSGLTTVTIPNSVTGIGSSAFQNCSGLTTITIPNSVTGIASYAFRDCSSLTSVTFSNNITIINLYAFSGCKSLTSITIPNSVTKIENHAFRDCSALTSVTFSNSMTSIGENAFNGCSALTSVTIPYYVGDSAFRNCSALTSLTIPNNVKRIGSQAFANCDELTDVYCLAEIITDYSRNEGLFTCSDAFQDSYPQYITLHVPETSIEAYRTTEPWSQFKAIVALESGDTPTVEKCAIPTISIEDGKIKFSCETEGVEFVSNVSTTDTKDYYDPELTLTYKYKVTVYATKDGYENSDTATREITITENGKAVLVGDVDGDGKVNVADHVELSKIIMEQ